MNETGSTRILSLPTCITARIVLPQVLIWFPLFCQGLMHLQGHVPAKGFSESQLTDLAGNSFLDSY